MKKQLNEEISRIKNMMKKINEGRFFDDKGEFLGGPDPSWEDDDDDDYSGEESDGGIEIDSPLEIDYDFDNPPPGYERDFGTGYANPERYSKKQYDLSGDSEKEEINTISKGLIDMGMFEPFELDGKMRNSFSKEKLEHNEIIRKAIDKIADENNISNVVKSEYWNNFW